MEYRCHSLECKRDFIFKKLVEVITHRIDHHPDDRVAIDRLIFYCDFQAFCVE